jgi:hypothetical protein
MRTLAGIFLALLASPIVASSHAAADGLPDTPQAQVQLFATCAGRLSALMEHQWLHDGPASEATRALRDAFVDLTDAADAAAVAEGLAAHQAMAWRVEAKAAAAGLLAQAAFGPADRRAGAARMAKARIAECRGLLPSA